ncbi:hypothetical protein ACP70R_003850 [Stipagrostis hirtigluma subsp. patula]
MARLRQHQGRAAAAAAREGGKVKEKGKGKGKEMEVEVREEGNEVAAAKGAGQSFFKIFFPEQSGERLKIPVPFHHNLEDRPAGTVSLKSSSGKTWKVELSSGSEGFCFARGWKEFVRDHSIKKGSFLVFTYDGHSQFFVMVFCQLGIEDPSALVAKPCTEIVVKVEDDAAGTSEVLSIPPEEVNGTTGKRTREMNDLLADSSASKKHSSLLKKAEKKRSEAIVSTSKAALTYPRSNEDYSKSVLDEFASCRNKTQVRSKDVSKTGKLVSRKTRQPIVISQRRPVTEEEKNLALKRANEFKSKNPFVVQIMMDSYVYVGFFMNIPCEFVRESLPKTSKKMTLWDPQGKPWEVNYVYYHDRGVAAFSGGWGRFSLGNNLEKFDVCVFELLKEDNIKVHIYRVVPEITPLLRSSNK